MTKFDPHTTQRDVAQSVAEELAASGFGDVGEIGRGGFGVVFRCRQPSLGRTVAVKVLTADLEPEDLARFVREQQAMGQLSGHPNIATIFEAGTLRSGRPFIIMQYYPRRSLETRIHTEGPLGCRTSLRIGIKIAGALATSHRLGILHRDVKPANILLTEYGEPQLMDFGIAHMAGGFETATGTLTGSPAYIAPEVLKGDPSTIASDIYSLGATLFSAMTGHAAFERRSGEQVFAQFVRITTCPVPQLGAHIPEDIRMVVERAMAASSVERPQTAEEFGELLREAERTNNLDLDQMALPDDKELDAESHNETIFSKKSGSSLKLSSRSGESEGAGLILPVQSRDGNLPLELTSFVGRRRELSEAKHLLSESRLLTLTGPGGVGKTRLALRIAAETRRSFSQGVWLIELAEIEHEERVADSVAAALGLRERSARPPLTVVAEFLFARQVLLILDNCEHLIWSASALAQSLLKTCPGLRIIATSREMLNIAGEVVLRVAPLAVPDVNAALTSPDVSSSAALALFADRARTAVSGFELTDQNSAPIAQICQRLDGLPLSIELAAVRVRTMTANQILDRLTDQFALLSGARRGTPSRQQTLRLSVDWSYGLCTQEEQQLWIQLAVFSGGFELDAIQGICGQSGTSGQLLDTVTSLVDKSILVCEEIDGVVRFRMLEILREYGREKLQKDAQYTVLRRHHRDWYKNLAITAEAEWITPQQMKWIARLRREHSNLRDALEFCVTERDEATSGIQISLALHPFWFTRGLFSEGRRWIERALTDQSGPPTRERIEALCNQGMMAGLQGDIQAGIALLAMARDLATKSDITAMQTCIVVEGTLALYSGDPARAVSCFEEALDSLRDEDRPVRLLEALTGHGLASWLLDHTTQAVASHDEVLEITERRGESVYRTYSLWGLGLVKWREHDLVRANQLLEEGVRNARNVDDPVSAALCIEMLAWIAAEQNQEVRAAELMGAARALRHAVGGGGVHIPAIVEHHRACEQRTRRILGKRAYEAAYRRGSVLNFQQTLANCLGESSPAQAEQVQFAPILTRREKQVAELVATGLTNNDIAAKLLISPRTAQGHVEHILSKLGFTSRTQIAVWVTMQGRGGDAPPTAENTSAR